MRDEEVSREQRPVVGVFPLAYPTGNQRHFDVTQDGERFVTVLDRPVTDRPEIRVGVNWLEELNARVPVERE